MNTTNQESIEQNRTKAKQYFDTSVTKANELLDYGLELHLDWIDKLMRFGIGTISASVLILITLQEKFKDAVCLKLFFWMWIAFLSGSIGILIVRKLYVKLKLKQSGRILGQGQLGVLVANSNTPLEWLSDEQGNPWSQKDKENLMKDIQSNQKVIHDLRCEEGCYKKSIRYLEDISLFFFFVGIVLLIIIGYQLVY